MTGAISPEATFADAQDALARQDWEGFFSCLDRSDLLKIAVNSMNALLSRTTTHASLATLGKECGLPDDLVHKSLEQAQAMTASSQAVIGEANPAARAAASARHRQLVLEYEGMISNGMKSVPDLARFTAGLEKLMRAELGGGSVSGGLFQGETLHGVTIDGKRAWAMRRSGDWEEQVGFVQKKGTWYIRLSARRSSP